MSDACHGRRYASSSKSLRDDQQRLWVPLLVGAAGWKYGRRKNSGETMTQRDKNESIVMTESQFKSTADFVWCSLKPWLELHFGEKCDDYEYGCECCERWRLAEQLLAYNRIGTPEKIEQEIATLKECLRWREELLAEMTAAKSESKSG